MGKQSDVMKSNEQESGERSSHFDVQTDNFEFEDEEGTAIARVQNLLDGAKKYVLQPMLIGFSAAFGMSVGYAFYDYTLSLLKRTKAET
ncbi:hypothetical protein NDN08_003698 [Rhodosorus marinus]|uniref:Uncharacterized protein n=1 Tax=Rhodosorus marinus TaxID=101924 RepID=A0AAV8V0X1_9RHOD|nr:hypothetical protein NDN08_003698 [Rhodosorus marinus]